jgi:chromosome segregation ATPase
MRNFEKPMRKSWLRKGESRCLKTDLAVKTSDHERAVLMLACAKIAAEEFAIEANERDENLKSQIIDLESCVVGLKGAVEDLEMKEESLIGMLSASQEEVDSLDMCVEENVIALKEGGAIRLDHEKELFDKAKEIEGLEARCVASDESITGLETANRLVLGELDASRLSFAAEKDRVFLLVGTIDDYKCQIVCLESCVVGLKGAIEDLEMEKESLIGELSLVHKVVDSLDMRVEENVVALKEGGALRLNHEKELFDKAKEIECLEARCVASDESIQNLEAEISDLKADAVLVKHDCGARGIAFNYQV